jgi:hypothetical protein
MRVQLFFGDTSRLDSESRSCNLSSGQRVPVPLIPLQHSPSLGSILPFVVIHKLSRPIFHQAVPKRSHVLVTFLYATILTINAREDVF